MDLDNLLNTKINSINFTQNLFERTNIGFFAKNVKGKIISLNTFMLSIYGVDKKSAVLGKSDFDFLPSHFAKSITKDDFFVLKNGKPIILKHIGLKHRNIQFLTMIIML